jgi:lipoprotein-anchoring transpeptidase ErfK/SrfK
MNRMGTGRDAMLVRALALAAVAVVVVGAVGVVLWNSSTAGAASSGYQEKRHALAAELAAASRQGYTASDLAPVTSQVSTLDGATEPWWLPGRRGYFQAQAAQAGALRSQLSSLEQRLKDQARTDAGKQADTARTAIAQAQQANADDLDVQSLQQRLDAVSRAEGAAHTFKDYRAATSQAQSVAQDAATLLTSTQQENQQLAQAVQQLTTQSGGNLGAMQQAGNQAVFNANNDASVIAYLSKEGPFKGSDTVARITSRLSKYAGLISSGDIGQAAMGTAAAQRYSGQIHDTLMAGLPAKSVIVSFQAQHVWAYEGSKVVMDNAVTTGIRGEGDFGTDFGPMKVLHKNHPWKFQSPWPKGSPHWYPDTVVQWTTFFTSTGEAFHDAAWQPDSTLGPGSQFTQGLQSHGCIHVPADKAQWMYGWADAGMPVIVYPGDGSSVANQLAQITTNDQGVPHSGGG